MLSTTSATNPSTADVYEPPPLPAGKNAADVLEFISSFFEFRNARGESLRHGGLVGMVSDVVVWKTGWGGDFAQQELLLSP